MNKKYELYCIDCFEWLKKRDSNSLDLMVTSPPYYNARDYSQWNSLEDYMNDMEKIFSELYRCMKNHKYIVVNVGDIIGKVGKTTWSTKKIPLGAMFTVMLEKIGFQFIDDYIWDKGEPQSKRHLGNPQYPFYQYPVNSYEHILIFAKHELDKTKIPCPSCNETVVVSNGQNSLGVQGWECKNPKCNDKSKTNRGKRFSQRSIMMNKYQKEENFIDSEFIKKWRRDIVKINPVVKINSKGENIVGHSAPFPKEIPEMAIKYFSGVGDIVVDIFSGSGTTGVACIENNRRYIGLEIQENYYNLSRERLSRLDKLDSSNSYEVIEYKSKINKYKDNSKDKKIKDRLFNTEIDCSDDIQLKFICS